MASFAAQLYKEDLVRWSEEQSAALRAASAQAANLPLDWENLAEEIESLGRSERRELRSRLAVILEHLIKLQCSPAADPRRGWIETIGRERSEVGRLIKDSPSLAAEVAGMIPEEPDQVATRAIDIRRRYGEATPEIAAKIRSASYTRDQVLGRWFPGDPALPVDEAKE